jgi:3-oxoacyl-[acyl-carrier protein] reductase
MDLGLRSLPVIVCASSAGLGRATATEYAREGAQVMLVSRREGELKQCAAEIAAATGTQPRYAVADLGRAVDIARVVEETVQAFGGVYALVNNGGGPPAGSFDQFDDAAWQSAFELTLLSFVRMTRAVLPHMRARGGGRIVNFTSSSVKSPIDNLILSNTFRTGVLGLSKTLAGELGPEGILVNVVGPGRIQTDRITHLDGLRARSAGVTPDQIRAEHAKVIPLGRYGEPAELARLAVFLGSPANTYVTGQTVLVDGGMVKSY